jgi:hypothetical protein
VLESAFLDDRFGTYGDEEEVEVVMVFRETNLMTNLSDKTEENITSTSTFCDYIRILLMPKKNMGGG